jgi:phage terminase small subunit
VLPTTPPSDLDAESRAVWRIALAELELVGSWTLATAPLLALYVRALQTARLARSRIAARFDQAADAAFFALGSTGQLVAHVDLAIARAAERDAATYAGLLLLSPAARRRAQVVPEGDEFDDELERALVPRFTR